MGERAGHATVAAVGALVVVAVALQIPLWRWEVEDAAITFAYADNFVRGDGLVPQAGAERVEGYSNPAWLAVLVPFLAVGIDPFVVSRWVGCALAAACVPVVWHAARPLGPAAAFASAAFVALSAGHAIWAQSGLENALFALLAAGAILRTTTAGDRDLCAPLLFFLLASTRPDGVAWAAIGCLFALGSSPSWRSLRARLLRWTVGLALPLAATEIARIAYFAQELPATFHAKVGQGERDLLAWNGRGWKQTREVAGQTASVLLLVLAGAVGTTRWRGAVSLVVIALSVVAMLVLPDRGRAAFFLAVLALVALLSLGRPRVVALATWLFVFGVVFQLGVGGDWMNGARFLSLVIVPAAIVAGAGLGSLANVPRLGLPVAALTMILFAVGQIDVLRTYARDPEATPASVKSRLEAWLTSSRKLGMVERPHLVDHDMGGMMWWGRDQVWFRDARGLVDLPFALHGRTHAAFARQELFGDRYPPFDFAHRHASTGQVLGRLGPQMRDYVEIPGYGRRVEKHKGQWIRRDLLLVESWPHARAPIRFAGGVTIEGVHVPSPEVAPGSALFLEIGMRREPRLPFRVVAFLVDEHGVGASWDLAPAHDWLMPPRWRPKELFHGRFGLRLPEMLGEGTWDLGLVVLDQHGAVLPAEVPHARPELARGEVRLPGAVTIVSGDRMNALAGEDLASAVSAARDGRCTDAEAAFTLAVRHRARSLDWQRRHRREVAPEIAGCWSARASAGPKEGEALLARIVELQHARDWDPRAPSVWTDAEPIASEAHARALVANDDEERFRWYDAAVRADPRRAWDRRWAEQARARLLADR